MSRLDLNLARVLVAIHQTRSVTKAAELLSLTQPTLSAALGKLREAYGDRLFVRNGSTLSPTALADSLAETFGQALKTIDGTLEQRHRFEPLSSTRHFKIAMSDIGMLYFVPRLLRHFRQVAPHVELDMVSLSEETHDDLVTARLDLAVGNVPSLVNVMPGAVLFEEHYVCLLATDHPTIGETMTWEHFLSGRHILVTSPASGHRLIDDMLVKRGARRHIAARIPHFAVLPQLLAESDFLVILPSRVAAVFVHDGRLKTLPLPIEIPSFKVRAHWHHGREELPAQRWLIDQVIATLGGI